MMGLCRGKRIDNNEWVYGFYFCIHHNDDRKHLHHFIIPLNTPVPKDKPIGEIQVEINPDTIGRCVGNFSDKNGKKIFEGDIVKGFYKPTDKLVCGNVKYEDRLARMLILNRGVCAGLSHCHHVEVIGNIHDNPELLLN